MRLSALAASIVVALTAWTCGGSSSSPNNPTPPTPTPSTAGVVSISIQGNRGAQSFAPNPGAVAEGGMVAWQNSDNVTHHIVLNDGSLDTGDIAPGQSSPAMKLTTNGARYHCTIHPSMVGSINTSSGTPPPCTGAYC